MEVRSLLDKLEFHEPIPFAQPLLVDQDLRILRWMLKPGQSIKEHDAPGSPFYVVVLQGLGVFTGSAGEEQVVHPGTLLIFEPGEGHTVRALEEELVFVGFLLGVKGMRPERTGGEIGREDARPH